MWKKLGSLIILRELQDTVRPDWTGSGVQLWVERKLNEISEEK